MIYPDLSTFPGTVGFPPSPPRNRLSDESSPYLLQHADNPIGWYP